MQKDDKGAPLSAQDIKLIMRYGKGAYNEALKKAESEVTSLNQKITNIALVFFIAHALQS